MRIAIIPATAACTAVLIATAAPAHADKQGFLDFTAGADYSNAKAAEMVCDVLHNGGTPADIPFLRFQQNAYRDVIIDGARRFICPDTLH
jgi:hypothetical protein